MKQEKIALIGHAIELTKLARGPVAQMPPPVINADGSITLSAAQELENRYCARVFTEMYDFVQRVTDDETVFHDPADEAAKVSAAVAPLQAAAAASPAGVIAAAAQLAAAVTPALAAANPALAPAAATVVAGASALSAMLNKPLGS